MARPWRWTAARRWRWAATSISCATGARMTGRTRATQSRPRTRRTGRRGHDPIKEKKTDARRGLTKLITIPLTYQFLEHDVIRWNRHHALALCLSMISAQTRSAFVARENRFPLFRIML